MKRGTVLILYTSALFAKGLATLLGRERMLKIEGLVRLKKNGWRQMRALRPDVVIIEGDNPMVEATSVLCELLKDSTRGFVVSVNLNQKDAVVYIGIRLVATESNLIKAVKNGVRDGFLRFIGEEGKDESIQKRKVF